MKRLVFLLVLVGALCMCRDSFAAPDHSQLLVPRQIPNSVRVQSPRGYKSALLRVAKIGLNRSHVLLHLYTVLSRPLKGETAGKQRDFLDVFVPGAKKGKDKKTAGWQQINSIELDCDEVSWFRSPGGFRFSTLAITWLNPRLQQHAIIRLGSPHSNLDEASLFVMFPKGLHDKATLQAFGSSSNPNGFFETTFDKVDERGFMVITETSAEMINGEPTGWTRNLHWNGTRFAERESK